MPRYLINKKQVKKFCHSHGKEMPDAALYVLEQKIKSLLLRTFKDTAHYKRIRPQDIAVYSYGLYSTPQERRK
jgi:uncharacterized protein YhbP (UPF0306 family)